MAREPMPSKSPAPKEARFKKRTGSERPPQNLPEAKFVTTATLTNRTCKWPIGDPGDPDFHYCGDQTVPASPYCERHDERGYQPLPPRKII